MTIGEGAATEPNAKATIVEARRRPRGDEPECLAVARHRFRRRQRPVRRLLRRRLLLQDLHRPVPRRLDALRALHPPRGRPRQRELRARPGPLRDRARLLRRAGRGRRSRRAVRGARRRPRRRPRHPLRRQPGARRRRSTSKTRSPAEMPADWLVATVCRARRRCRMCAILTRTSVYGYYDDNVLGAVEQIPLTAADVGRRPRQRHWRIQAKRVVLAAGALERPFVFPGNDTPGVMLAGAALAYARRYGVAVGREVVVFTNNDAGWRRAASLLALGRADARRRRLPPRDPEGSRRRSRGDRHGIPHRACCHRSPRRQDADVGDGGGLRSEQRPRLRRARARSPATRLLVSAGWNPLVHLASQAGGPPVYDEATCGVPARRSARGLGGSRRDGRHLRRRRGRRGRCTGGRRAARSRFGLRCGGDVADHAVPAGAADRSDNLFPLFEDAGQGQGLRRHAERRHGLGCPARPPGGLRVGRAPEALHDARHGGRPGQDLQPERPRHPRPRARACPFRPSARRVSARPTIPSASARSPAARAAVTCSRFAARRSTTGTSRPAPR